MIAWIDRAGSYRVEGLLERPPGIVFALVGDVLDLGPVVMPVEPGMRGAYHPVVNAVVLVLPWHIDDIDDRSVLLHELVHAVQWQARDWPCAAEMEWDAYGLQREWLSEHGIEMQMDWLTVGILSSCPEVSP